MNILLASYLFISAFILLFLAVIGWQRRRVPGSREFALFSASSAFLVASYALELTQADLEMFRFILHLEWLSAPFISMFWLLFSLVWCGYGHIATRNFRIALMVIPTVDMLLAQTNDIHKLVYKRLWVDYSGAFPIFMTDNGPFLWVDFVYSNACMFIAAAMFVLKFRKVRPIYRRQALIMILASLIPTFLNLLYYLEFGGGVYLTAFGLSVTAILFAWGIFRQHILDLTPVARHGLVEMMKDPVLVFDQSGRLVDHNRAACRLLHDKDGHETETTREDIARRNPELALALYWVEHGESDTFHYNDQKYSLSLTTLNPTEEHTLSLYLLHDITEQFRAEEKLRLLNVSLEERVAQEVELNRAKDQALARQSRIAAMGEMIAAIAHQWRQPLSTLSMTVQDFCAAAHQTGTPSQKEWDEFKADAMEQILYMSRTIDEFRNFQHPSQRLERFPVARCLEESLRLTNAQFKEYSIVQELNIPPDKQPYCFGAAGQLTQVLLNLLVNAKEAIECSRARNNGYPYQGRVVITLSDMKDKLQITVVDNGCGVSDELRDRLFEPYITSKEDLGGSGLGLYLAKMLVETGFNGTLAHSSLSEGTCFVVEIPATAEGSI